MKYDKIIIGAGLYGLYAALFCARNHERILVLEQDSGAFKRATYINQARVHMGYHYPRSYSTAIKSAHYFQRFMEDYRFCILESFDQVYATSANFSWSNAEQFLKFCQNAGIRCDEINPERYFHRGLCDGAFLTEEYTYDARILRDYFLGELEHFSDVKICYDSPVTGIERHHDVYRVFSGAEAFESGFVLNSTYASTNQINRMVAREEGNSFKIKYELCEIILCEVSPQLKKIGLTVMDGPFFSIMPFGKTGLHSLTSVCFTPHMTSYEVCPTFECQSHCASSFCTQERLGNYNDCLAKPKSAWPYMSQLAHKYMRDELGFSYRESLFSMKPILKASEIDDSRPTVVRVFTQNPTFVSVLSGKINTVYDLDEVLRHE